MKKLAVLIMSVMGGVACGEPEAQVIYHEGQEPEVIPRGTVVGPGGGVADQGGMMPGPNPNTNPGTGSWPVTPDMLGPSTPISTTPCDLGDRRSLFSESGSVYFSDGVLRCTAPSDSTNISLNWKHSSTSTLYMRIGGGAWMSYPGELNPADVLPTYFVDIVPVAGGSTVDIYIQDSSLLGALYLGFDDPADAELGG